MSESNRFYTREERAIACDIVDYSHHIKYHENRARILRQEVDRLRGVMRESLKSRGYDYDRLCHTHRKEKGMGKKIPERYINS